MNEKINLYYFSSGSIVVTIDAFFQDWNLVVEGYDNGKIVEEAWGDSEYEYSITVKKKILNRFIGLNK